MELGRKNKESFKSYKNRIKQEKYKQKMQIRGKYYWLSTDWGTCVKNDKGECLDKHGNIIK